MLLRSLSRRRTALPLLCMPLLAACGLLPAPAPQPALHDLGAVVVAGQLLPWQLGTQISAPPWLDDGAVHYRPDGAARQAGAGSQLGATRLAAYRDHRWAAPPSALLERRLRARIAAPQPGAPARWLEIELTAFEQRFAATGSSAHIAARALLRERRGGALLASRDFTLEQPAASADVAGGVAALAAGADRLAAEVLAWLAAVGGGS